MELLELKEKWNLPWCISDDFNTTVCQEERSGGQGNLRAMQQFSQFINDVGLIDLPLNGSRFTWSNNRVHPISTRIDRFLISSSFAEIFPDLIQSSLPRPLSDHTPIVLSRVRTNWGPKNFRFFSFWLDIPEFEGAIKDALDESVKGDPNRRQIDGVLRGLKPKLKQWQKEFCNQDSELLSNLEQEIDLMEKEALNGSQGDAQAVELQKKKDETMETLQL